MKGNLMKKLLSIGLAALILSGCGQAEPQKIELAPDGQYFDAAPVAMLEEIQRQFPSNTDITLDTDGDNPGLTIVEPSGAETYIIAFDGDDKRASGILISAPVADTDKNELDEYYLYELPKIVLETMDLPEDGADDLAKSAYRNFVENYYTSGTATMDGITCFVSSVTVDGTLSYYNVIAPETNGFWK